MVKFSGLVTGDLFVTLEARGPLVEAEVKGGQLSVRTGMAVTRQGGMKKRGINTVVEHTQHKFFFSCRPVRVFFFITWSLSLRLPQFVGGENEVDD